MSQIIWTPPPRTADVLATAGWALDVGLWPVAITAIDSKSSSPGKRPLGGDEWGRERRDLDWFRASLKRHPKAGIGLKLGPEGGVVDLDVDEPDRAAPVLERLFPDGIPPTLGWSNAGGKFHLLFRWDGRLARFKAVVKGGDHYPGLELRIGAEGKQLQSVCPPSLLPNAARRKWNEHEKILALPGSVLEDLERNFPAEAPPTPRPVRPRRDANVQVTDLESRAVAYLAKCEPAISGKSGHNKAFKAACKVGPGFDLPPEMTLRLMREHYSPLCEPPWSEEELEHKVTDAYAKEANRGWLRDAPPKNGSSSVGFVASPPHESSKNGEKNGEAEGGFVSSVSTQVEGPPTFSGPPKPILTTLRPVPEFNPVLLPTPLRAWTLDITDRMQCAIEYPAVAAIITLATVVGRKMAIRPKRHDSWTVIPNVWGMIVGRPGVLKSPALVEAMKPLNRLIAEAMERHAAAIEGHNRSLMIAGAKRDGAKENLKKAAKGGRPDVELERLAALATAADEGEEPVLKRYQTSDSTVPKLGELLRDNPNGILIYRDELQGFLRSLDKQGSESDRAFYLEGWNGNSPFDYDRIERGHIHIDAVCLSLLGGIQPGPLAAYLRTALSGVGDDGLISRFQLAVYPDQDREFRIVDRAPDVGAKNRAFDVFRAVDSLNPMDLGCEPGEEKGEIPYIRFNEDSQILFYDWLTDLQKEKLSGNEPEAMESHLAKYRSLMPSLALLFHVVDVVDGASPGPVSLAAARRAAAWCDLLEEHARRIHQAGGDGDMGPARGLAEKLTQSLPNPFKARDVIRKQWSGLTTNDEVEHALGILEEHDWVRPVEAPTGPRGGRPTIEYHVNPGIGGGGA